MTKAVLNEYKVGKILISKGKLFNFSVVTVKPLAIFAISKKRHKTNKHFCCMYITTYLSSIKSFCLRTIGLNASHD